MPFITVVHSHQFVVLNAAGTSATVAVLHNVDHRV